MMSLVELTEQTGNVPLPPYMRREADAVDIDRYQTVWARRMGSAAAPTASLNMTVDLLGRLRKKGVRIAYLTLHVGLGTFLPMRNEKVEEHNMHTEWFDLPEKTIAEIRRTRVEGGRVIALGTTVARTLEYWGKTGKVQGENDLFIYSGFDFTIVNGLITNFHAPKSTVLMLAAAFAGWDNLKMAYTHAVRKKYAFLSYGDSMLVC
jgi:S-adenosylmethionine:tRNA ribosyltransferase-isomerase